MITPAAILLPFVVERARVALEGLEQPSLLPGCRCAKSLSVAPKQRTQG